MKKTFRKSWSNRAKFAVASAMIAATYACAAWYAATDSRLAVLCMAASMTLALTSVFTLKSAQQ